MKEIPLSRGRVAIVDDEDFEHLSQWKWFCTASGYAVRNSKSNEGTKRTIFMHRVIMGDPTGFLVDHKSMDTLDNRRINLRVATKAQNMSNRGPQANNKSGFKGVFWNKQKAKWNAKICVNKKHVHLGFFKSSHDAHQAYFEGAKRMHGEFSKA